MSGQSNRNGRLGLGLAAVVAGMVGLSFAAVPAYRLFCDVTGFGGTTQVADAPSEEFHERVVRVRFAANTNRDMPWDFQPETREVSLHLGEPSLVAYRAGNPTDEAITGIATFNVTPLKAGLYFSKVQCFCFEEQTLAAGQEVDMPVYFYVDPAMAEDPNLDDVEVITLSYTFFRSNSKDLDQTVETVYQSETSDLPVGNVPTGG